MTMLSVARETIPESPKPKRRWKHRKDVSVCSRCENEPPLPNQRYGRNCHNAAQREYWARLKRDQEKLKQILRIVEKIQP